MNDNLVVNAGRKAMELLPSLDHDEIVYDDFVKDFYKEPQALEALSPAEVCICEPPHHALPPSPQSHLGPATRLGMAKPVLVQHSDDWVSCWACLRCWVQNTLDQAWVDANSLVLPGMCTSIIYHPVPLHWTPNA